MTIRYEFADHADLIPPPTCSVWVNGIRMADGQVGEPDSDPVALTNLRIVWGRSSTLDQPAPSTCTFDVMDLAGGQSFLNVIRVGDRVDIRTDATVSGDPTVPVFPALPLANAYVTNGTINASTGAVAATDATKPVVVFIPPAARSSDPSAWNGVPRSLPSATWHASVVVTLQTDLGTMLAKVALAPVAYRNPSGAGAVVGSTIASAGPGVTGAQTLAGDFQPTADVWVGLALTFFPTGPVWSNVPIATLWNSLGATPVWSGLNRITIAPSSISLLAPPAGSAYAALVFSGRVTDLRATYDLDVGGTVVQCIAQDHTADLGNRYVGDVPWLAQTLAARFAAIVAAGGSAVKYTVDPVPGALPVTWRDVDAQPTTRLLQELAYSAAGVLWSATDLVNGPYLHLEDVAARPPLGRLTSGEIVANLFPRPSFEDGLTTGFGVGNAALTVPTAANAAIPGRSGTKVLRATITTTGTLLNIWTSAAATQPDVKPGKLYRFATYTRGQSSASSAQLYAEYRDSGGVLIAGTQVSSPVVAHPASQGWTRVELTVPAAPANAVKLFLYWRAPGAGATAGQWIDFDAITVHEVASSSDTTLPYFDGDTTDTTSEFYDWTGAQWSSSSTRQGPIVIVGATSVPGALTVSACSLLLEPVEWVQATDDKSTRVAVGWWLQGTDADGVVVTQQTALAVDAAEEARSGRRRIGIQTQLSTAVAAQQTAELVLARVTAPGWRISGLTWRMSPQEPLTAQQLRDVLTLLDGTTRIGLPILLVDLPSWSPISSTDVLPLYVEGGRYSNVDGFWTLELLVSDAKSQGVAGVAWNQVPAPWVWNQFDPSIAWGDLAGVGI